MVAALVDPHERKGVGKVQRRRLARIGALAAVLTLGIAACGGSSGTTTGSGTPSTPSADSTSSQPTTAAAQTYTVLVDGHKKSDPTAVAFSTYFPKEVAVHPGDTVSFTLADSGEPHTVALGSVIGNCLDAADKITNPGPDTQPPPECQKVPQLLPQGPGDALQAAAQPCVVATGDAPSKDACPTKTESAFTGTESLVSSGWMTADTPFDVKLSDNVKAGTYRYTCQLHDPDMQGSIKVVDSATTVPSPSEAAATGESERQQLLDKLAPAISALSKATASTALAGNGSEDVQEAQVDAFGPKNISIPVGGSVTWTMFGDHTIAFNAPADAQKLRQAAPDGSVHVNVKGASPAGGPGADPNADPSKAPPLIDGGKWDGSGFRASGLFLSFPPQQQKFKLTFTKAGTYKYICQVHEDMAGTVNVT